MLCFLLYVCMSEVRVKKNPLKWMLGFEVLHLAS